MNPGYSTIFSNSNKDSRANVVNFLRSKSTALQESADAAVNTAYDIAGLMATDFARQLSQDDPIDEVLTIAGELEIRPINSEALRQELIQKIDALE